jgi:hypothetical protein
MGAFRRFMGLEVPGVYCIDFPAPRFKDLRCGRGGLSEQNPPLAYEEEKAKEWSGSAGLVPAVGSAP